MKLLKRKNKFTVSDHARNRFKERFPDFVLYHGMDIDKAIRYELNESVQNSKSTAGNKVLRLMRNNYEEARYFTSAFVVFVVSNDGIILTVYPRAGSYFDSPKAKKNRKHIALAMNRKVIDEREEWYQKRYCTPGTRKRARRYTKQLEKRFAKIVDEAKKFAGDDPTSIDEKLRESNIESKWF